ncbi:hypothetical protein [Pontibacter cellulosilyticus]|uniref:Outer membrane protein beta-barrel domain-containing protein n=1 Tax=Pontibacter cellulosilyticus TaxID=1720253 RepID=A0A923N2E9_9BACT|nr:hypothetical protein [Pontibacter cellulosilyticus]MBC5991635.1 hypothetical protein [Pontibacter cellulosilyticus]
MRKILLLLLFIPCIAFAQENESYLIKAKVKQGSIMLGGTLHASAYKTTDELSSSQQTLEGSKINVMFRAKNGYFVLHDLVVGLDVTIDYQSTRITSDAEQNKPDNHTFGLMGPFVRYYLDNGVFGELTTTVGFDNFSANNKYNLFETSAGVGYAFFFNEKFSIEPTLSVRYFQQTLGDKKYTSIGPVLGVGIQAYLLRKKAHVIKRAL